MPKSKNLWQEVLSEDPATFSSMTTGTDHHAAVRVELTERDREVLEFERHWWKHTGARESAVREKFDMSPTRYFQVVNWLIDQPAALEADPMLVRRLRRLRERRQAQRSARRAL